MNKSVDLKKLSFFAALCFFLSVVETAIPKPVPFFRLGLANLTVMLSFAYMSRKESSLLILLKVLLQAIVSGTLFSYIFLFSLAGSFASGFGMMVLYTLFNLKFERDGKKSRSKLISWIGISMWGGLLNNAAQLTCAYFIMFGDSVRYIAPVLLTISLVTSFLLGLAGNIFDEQSEWLKVLKDGLDAPRGGAPAAGSSEATEAVAGTDFVAEGMSVSEGRNTGKAPILFLLLAIAGILVTSFIKNLILVYSLMVVFAVIVFIKKKRIRVLPSGIIILSVTVLSLLTPYGKILFTLGKWNITWGAMEAGLLRSGKLCAMVFMSQSAVDKNMKLPGTFGAFMERVFGTVAQLTEEKISWEKGTKFAGLVSMVDKKLLEVWAK
ncbi:MAG: Gx transporter family protein [Treponema sp.]|nr:Gx transporter family protein [Treponema sp.]